MMHVIINDYQSLSFVHDKHAYASFGTLLHNWAISEVRSYINFFFSFLSLLDIYTLVQYSKILLHRTFV